jgi:hypothetical protein
VRASSFCHHERVLTRLQLVSFALFVSVACVAGAADDYEYGKPGDLKGLTAYYLDTRTDITTRNEVETKVRAETDRLRLVDKREEAQIIVDATGGDSDGGGPSFLVYVAGEDGRPRLIQKFKYTHSKLPRLRPTSRFAQDFVALWRQGQAPAR